MNICIVSTGYVGLVTSTFLANFGFHATFINEIANLCDKVGADMHQIAKAMGLDGRISLKFLHPGPGYGVPVSLKILKLFIIWLLPTDMTLSS